MASGTQSTKASDTGMINHKIQQRCVQRNLFKGLQTGNCKRLCLDKFEKEPQRDLKYEIYDHYNY